MNIRTLFPSRRRHLLVLLLPALVALLLVALVVGSLTVLAFGDLTVSFSSDPSPDPVRAGTSYSFTAEVTVGGTTNPPAEAVVFEYRAPAGVVIESIQQSTPGDCEVGTPGDPSDPSTCSLGNMGTGGISSATIDVTVFVPPDIPDGTLLDNDIQAWQFGTEEEPPDNEAHYIITVEAEADLVITKSARGDNVTDYDQALRQFIKEQRDSEVTAGELLEYTLVITNTGPSDAQNVVVTDTLPPPAGPVATVHFVSADGADCRQDPVDRNLVTCELGTMAVTETRTIHILVRVDPTVPEGTVITNSATVSSTTTDPDTTSSGHQNTATNDTTVNAVADVYITKVDVPAETRLDQPFEPDQAIAGLEHRYLITFGNDGPSVARSVGVTDTLDIKQAGILGETFVRCEPTDIDDLVVCSEAVMGTVTVDSFLRRLEQIIPGDLNPGDEFSFWLITEVDPGYVLDADDTGTAPGLLARNSALIGTTTTDCRCENDQDTEDTEIIAEADLSVSKTDTPDPGLPDQYLTYDPVSNHFVFTYTITVDNLGPSDAATVMLTDTLPVDAEFLYWTIPDNMTCVFRDDGTVFCLMGEDPNNLDNDEPGRLNVTSEISFTITARVDADSTPRTLVNQVEVGAVPPEYADVYFPTIPTVLGDFIPLIPDFQADRRPTADPDLDNNVYVEETTVLNARVRIDKKAVVGRDITGLSATEIDEICRTEGVDDFLTLPPAQVTYCYFVYNEGDTWLTNVEVTDAHNAEIVETVAGPFVNVIGRAGTGSEFTGPLDPVYHALWASIEDDDDSEVAPLAPDGVVHPDDYTYLLAVRSVILDFADGGTEKYGENTATVTADPCTKYSTILPGVWPVGDTDLLHDTLAVPVLEETTKEWDIHDDNDGDGLPSPLDVIEYTVDIPNTGIIEATGVVFTDTLYNYIHDNPEHPWVPATLINGSVSAAIHVYGREPITGREIDADVQPPDLAFGENLLLRTYAPAIGGGYLELTYLSAIVLDEEIVLGNNAGDDEILVDTRLAIPPVGYLLRFDGVTYDPPIPVTFSLRITYQVRIKETVQVDTIILNHGWVWYNEIDLFDERYPNFDPTDTDLFFDSNRLANNHAGTPFRDWETIEFPGWPEVPVGVEPTDYPGPRFDDYALPDAALRDDDDPTWFKVERESPSIGSGTRIQLPVLTYIADSNAGVETRIEIQNLGVKRTTAILWVWGEYSRQCPPQDPGPIKAECMGELEPGSAWVIDTLNLPEGAKSGILYSVSLDLLPDGFTRPTPNWPYPYAGESVDQYLCEATQSVSWKEWHEYLETHPEFLGTWLGTEVIRTGPGDLTPDVRVSGAYEGLSRAMEGVYDPKSGGYAYYASDVQSQARGFTTWLYIQNSGVKCTSVELWMYQRDDCMRPSVCQIRKLAPGETYQLDVTTCPGIGPGFEGSAYIRASQPLGIVADQVGRDLLLTHLAVPARLTHQNDWPPYFTAGSMVNYGPLIYREYQGWDTRLYVQNLSSTVNAKVKVYFLDNSGGIITTLTDWICPRGSQSYFLPVINNLAGHYIGAVRVESQDWWTPGDPPVDSPYIMSVAELIRYEGPARAYALEGLAYNLFGEDEAFDWQVGEITTWGVGLIGIPSLNRWGDDVTTELAIQNVVPEPGETDFAIYIYDQNGLIDHVCQKLNEKQVEYINLDTWGVIPVYFAGSAVISATHWQHNGSGSLGLAAVKVERVGTVLSHDIPGDESTGTRGFPLHRPFTFLRPEDVPECP